MIILIYRRAIVNDTTLDLRLTYICAHCGGLAEVSLWEIELLDSGTTLTCDKCGEKTVILLVKQSEYGCLAAYRSVLAFRLRAKG